MGRLKLRKICRLHRNVDIVDSLPLSVGPLLERSIRIIQDGNVKHDLKTMEFPAELGLVIVSSDP